MGKTYILCLQMSAVQMSAPALAFWIPYLLMEGQWAPLGSDYPTGISTWGLLAIHCLPLHWLWRDLKQLARSRCLHCCHVRWIPLLGSISIARGAPRSSLVTAWLLPSLAAGCSLAAVYKVHVGRAELQPAVSSPGWAGQTGQRRAWVHAACWMCMWSLSWGILELRLSRGSVPCLAGGPDCPQWAWLRLWPVGLGQISFQLGKQEKLGWSKQNYNFSS